MARLNCFDKIFGLLQLFAEKPNSLITTKDLIEFYDERFDVKYSLKTAQNDMRKMEYLGSVFPEIFKVKQDNDKTFSVKLQEYNEVVRAILGHYENAYILGVIRRLLDYSQIEKEKFDMIYKSYNKSYMYETIGFYTVKNQNDSEILGQICSAIETKRKVNFTYTRQDNIREYKEFNPYRIVIVEDGWYLYGKFDDEIDSRVFLISYINNFEKTNYRAEIPEDISKTIIDAKSIWGVTKREKVKINAELNSKIANKILELENYHNYFTNQKIIEKKENGNIIIEFDVADDNNEQVDFKKQVYTWLPNIRILSPQKYIDFIKDDFERMIGFQEGIQ